MAPCPPASRRTGNAATCFLYASCKSPGWSPALPPALSLEILLPVVPPIYLGFADLPVVNRLLPKPLATGVLHSLCTPYCLCHCPNPGHWLTGRTTAPLSALRRRKLTQFCFTVPAINTPLGLGTVPKTAAPLANFQLHAQFHDIFSIVASFPDGFALKWLFRGVKRTMRGNSGFLRPDGE
jgi:hypothetical protein